MCCRIRRAGSVWYVGFFVGYLKASVTTVATRYGTINGTSSGKEIDVMSITASEARKNLFPLIEQVNENREPIEITSKRGDAVLMARADFDALNETALLLRSPANARRLLKSLAQANAGERSIQQLS